MMSKILSIALFILIMGHGFAYALTCAVLSVEEEVMHSDDIFAGEVLEMKELKPYEFEIRLKPLESFKGDHGETVTVFTDNVFNYWGTLKFEVNEQYLVYSRSNGQEKKFVTVCGRSKKLNDAGEELDILRSMEPEAPQD